MSVALSIAFTGLCALIADGNGTPGQILLLDARGAGKGEGAAALPAHAPTLVVSLNDLANPDTSGPTRVVAGTPSQRGRVDQVGLWDLTGSEVRIRAQGGEGAGLRLFRPATSETSWPQAPRDVHDPASWRDLRFVANMKTLVGDGRIDPAFTDEDAPSPRGLPRSVAARVHLDAGLLEGAIPSQETYRNDVFEFRSGGSPRGVRQALTDTVQWTMHTQAAAIVIEITPAAGGPAKRLLLAPSAAPHRVFISNLPAANEPHAHHGVADEELSAAHFGAFYELLLNEPAERPLPGPWHPVRDRKAAGLRPVFCPPAMFSRQ
jgi:hypothetical protein